MTSTTIPAKKGGRKKSGFYHARWNRCGINEAKAAEVLGVSVDQVKEWDKTGNDLAERYLLLWDQKHFNQPGWEGFTFSRGLLKYKGRQQWTPESLHKELKRRESQWGSAYSVIDTKTDFRELRK